MASRITELALRVVADVSGGVAGLGDIETASAKAATAVEQVGTSADGVGSKLDGVGTSAENLDDKASKATGALGALSSGFALVGAEEYAGALEAAAMATDFASGVGQALTLILELESVNRAKAVVVAGAHTAATAASTAATGAATAAQWLLNAALSANPVALVVIAIAALAAGVVIAYQKSETFRDIVDAVFAKAKDVVGAVVDRVGDIVTKVGDVIDWVQRLPDSFSTAKDRVVGFVQDMLAPIQAVYDKIVALIDKITSIDFPDLPKVDVNPFSRANLTPAYQTPGMVPSGLGGADESQVVTLLAAILAALKASDTTVGDPLGTARMFRQLLARADRITG